MHETINLFKDKSLQKGF